MPTTRFIYRSGLFAIVVLLSISIYLQVFKNFIPCPLCTLQRIAFGMLGLLFLIGTLVYQKNAGRLIINLCLFLTSAAGLFVAGRQVWLQHFPGESGNDCGVSLQYMLQALPPSEVIQKVFAGSAECAQPGWNMFYLNMAEWSLLWFIGFLLVSVYLFARGK